MDKDNESEVVITATMLAATYPALVEQIRAEEHAAGHQQGREAGASGERERIAAIESITMAGHEALIAAAKADGKSTAAEVAMKMIAAEKRAGRATLAALADDDRDLTVKPAPIAAQTAIDPAVPALDDLIKAEWAKPEIRAEFSNDERRHVAFCRAAEAGRIRILTRAPRTD